MRGIWMSMTITSGCGVARGLDGRRAVGASPTTSMSGSAFSSAFEPGAQHGVIVGQHDADLGLGDHAELQADAGATAPARGCASRDRARCR